MYKTIIVTDDSAHPIDTHIEHVDFHAYLREYPKRNEPKTRILNLCATEQYLSQGYYCSLLAEARNHQILPSVKTINQLRNDDVVAKAARRYKALFPAELKTLDGTTSYLFFGKTDLSSITKFAARVFAQFAAPVLKLMVDLNDQKYPLRIECVSLSDIPTEQYARFLDELTYFTERVWRSQTQRKYRWDMAILVDPNEVDPPSNKEALSKFVRAAAKHGIKADLVSLDDDFSVQNYDALFIRETTAIDHHSYRLAVEAEQNGLVVMDDPQSILRCCNKVFLHDAFSYQKVASPKTKVVDRAVLENLADIEAEFTYPTVLKMPEGSFSRGVYKVNDREELAKQLGELFQESALVLVQEFMYTEFDWRIGILNGRPIYACRYLMARNHWQIYNHKASKRFTSGGFDALPTFEVPKAVLDMAVRAAKCVGNGLYGVDVKEKGGKAYVLEVNDNPSIEQGVENAYLGDELYMIIMAEFRRRLESRGV